MLLASYKNFITTNACSRLRGLQLKTRANQDVCAFAQKCLVTAARVARCFPSRVSHQGQLQLQLVWGGGSRVREVPALVRPSEI